LPEYLACCSFRKSEFTVFKGSLKFQRSSHLHLADTKFTH